MKKLANFLFLIMPILGVSSCLSGHRGAPNLPAFNLLLPDSVTVFNTNEIKSGKPSILIFFSPDCEHCQEETASILKNMDSLKDVNFYFFTVDPFDRLKAFKDYYEISKYPNIILGRDYGFYFPEHFKVSNTPYLVIYDQDKRRRAIFSGGTTAQKIIACINQL